MIVPTNEPYWVWYSEIGADKKTSRKCEPFGKELAAEDYVKHLKKLSYVENILIEQRNGLYTSKIIIHFTPPPTPKSVTLNFTIP